MADCCSEVLKRLDKLDEIERMLKDLADQNAALRKEVGDLKRIRTVPRIEGQSTAAAHGRASEHRRCCQGRG